MKVSIIGGGGLVGSCAAYALQCGGLAREIALLDVNQELAVGQALDLQHGGPSVADQTIVGGGYEHIPSSDVICITAGLRRKPDESRLDLINRNTDLFVQILNDVKAAGPKPTAIVLVVSNPVDILTYVAAQKLGLPENQVIGLGTQLDTIRFCALIAEQLKAPPTQTRALILGEHGESMVPVWSSATIAGLPLDKYPGWSPTLATQLFTRTRGSGAEVIKRKGGAGFAVGIAIRDVIDAVILDQRRVLPVSSVQRGCFGVRDVALSVPTVVGRTGVVDRMEIDLWPKEVQGMRASGAALRKTLDVVLKRIR
ncbi:MULTISPECIES: lactate/malate dehydrogenase family protein [Pirellulaceae]|uniref:lactate/malate dehydrogenase family protein n=1 Tax=Stieleria TaxID=2795973 RepID=UPI000BAE5CDC|nr:MULTISPECIES: lactate/malate dehydrogenase family protein [Pirellulaceae]MCS7467931.1 lactate/malate dehydrogenase family protein [Stieleria sedimenti]MDV6034825.1 lactate dehydrogenase [Phycisphaera sp. RhM]PAY15658.1 lactate dehydrogenase [Rhodopirellula sp. SM50]